MDPELLARLKLVGCFPARASDYTEYHPSSDYDFFCVPCAVSNVVNLVAQYLKIDHITERSYVISLFCTDEGSGDFYQVDLETSIEWWGLQLVDLGAAIERSHCREFLSEIEILRSFFWGKGNLAKKEEKYGRKYIRQVIVKWGFDLSKSPLQNRILLLWKDISLRKHRVLFDHIRFIYFEAKLFLTKNGLYLSCHDRNTIELVKLNIQNRGGRYKVVKYYNNPYCYRALRDFSNSAIIITPAANFLDLSVEFDDDNFLLKKQGRLIFRGGDLAGFLQNY